MDRWVGGWVDQGGGKCVQMYSVVELLIKIKIKKI